MDNDKCPNIIAFIMMIIFNATACAKLEPIQSESNAEEKFNGEKLFTSTLPDLSDPLQFYFLESSNRNGVLVTEAYNSERGYGFSLNTRINNEHKPFYFSVKVPESNYRVTIEFGHPQMASSNTVKAESRRLYLQDVETIPGEFTTRSFVVNVRNSLLAHHRNDSPTSDRVLLKNSETASLNWDDKLTLEFNGRAPQVRSVNIEKIDVPTLYLVGDSTVTDQSYEPAASWGQMLPAFFNNTIAIANHAESGETMKAFVAELRLAKVLETIKKGDYLFIQFGHNDQKQQWPQTYVDAETTYKAYLKVFVAEAQLRGAIPVLVTSVERRRFNSASKIENSHGKYPEAVRELAKKMNVALIDLEAMSVKFYEALGVEKAPLAFNDNGKDLTHHNNYGAYQLAKCVIQGIRLAKLPIVSQLNKNVISYDPANPDSADNFTLAPSLLNSTLRPSGN
ncbi:MAG: rhamnogalacturonan acetylesterase [Pseudomonadota bacterium]